MGALSLDGAGGLGRVAIENLVGNASTPTSKSFGGGTELKIHSVFGTGMLL